jgi:hypothetical protein
MDTSKSQTIVRDLCILGGGAAGTFAAIRLRDAGKTVAVVEQQDRLGGHTVTYQDPISHTKAEAGVAVIRDSESARQHFSRFGIGLSKFDPPSPVANVFVDFGTGSHLAFSPPDPAQALENYAAQLAKYHFLDNGFDLPRPLPEDLPWLPFGKFVEKHDLSEMVLLASKMCQGFGNFLVPDGVDNTELYRRAEAELADSLLLSSTVISSSRGDGCPVQSLVRNSSGQEMLIKADKLLVAIPATLANLANLDLDDTEKALFSQFQHSSWWTLLIRNSGIPDNYCITNLNSVYSSGGLPGIFEITPTGVPNTLNLKYGSPHHLPVERVKQDVLECLDRLHRVSPDLFQDGWDHINLEIALLVTHRPFGMTVPVSAFNDGFYDRPRALNGHRNTFWTGAAFQAHDASLIWEYTDGILRKHFF